MGDNKSELIKALVKFHSQVGKVIKSQDNPFFKSQYADLSAYLEVATPVLCECGLAVVQTVAGAELETTLWHESGSSISSRCNYIPVKQDAQSIGSALTYFRRYQLAAILSLAAYDDDANAASEQQQKDPKQSKQSKTRADYNNSKPSSMDSAKKDSAPPWDTQAVQSADLFDKVAAIENQISTLLGLSEPDFKQKYKALYIRHNANCSDGEKSGDWKMALASVNQLLAFAQKYQPSSARPKSPDSDFDSLNPIPADPALVAGENKQMELGA